jgi:hypothetical protein
MAGMQDFRLHPDAVFEQYGFLRQAERLNGVTPWNQARYTALGRMPNEVVAMMHPDGRGGLNTRGLQGPQIVPIDVDPPLAIENGQLAEEMVGEYLGPPDEGGTPNGDFGAPQTPPGILDDMLPTIVNVADTTAQAAAGAARMVRDAAANPTVQTFAQMALPTVLGRVGGGRFGAAITTLTTGLGIPNMNAMVPVAGPGGTLTVVTAIANARGLPRAIRTATDFAIQRGTATREMALIQRQIAAPTERGLGTITDPFKLALKGRKRPATMSRVRAPTEAEPRPTQMPTAKKAMSAEIPETRGGAKYGLAQERIAKMERAVKLAPTEVVSRATSSHRGPGFK